MSLNLEIVAPDRSAWKGEVTQVQIPGSTGEFGVLENHANLLGTTRPGLVSLSSQDGLVKLVVGAGFANVAHFKKWYKKAFLGIADFCLLQAFTAWNLSVDQMYANRRGNSNVRRKKIVKWQFCSVLAEEMMMFVDHEREDETIAQNNFAKTNAHRI